MDFNNYIETFVDNLKSEFFYSEVDENKLKDSFKKYLSEGYMEMVEMARFRFDLKAVGGDDLDKAADDFERELGVIKSRLQQKMLELSRRK